MSSPTIGGERRRRLRLKIAADVATWTVAASLAFPLRMPNRWMDLPSLVVLYALAGIPIKLAIVLGFGSSARSGAGSRRRTWSASWPPSSSAPLCCSRSAWSGTRSRSASRGRSP